MDASISLDDSQCVLPSPAHTASFREDQGQEIIIPRLPEKFVARTSSVPIATFLVQGVSAMVQLGSKLMWIKVTVE